MQDVWTCTTLRWVNLNRYTQNSSIHRFPRAPSVWELIILFYPYELINSRWTTTMASYKVGEWRVATSFWPVQVVSGLPVGNLKCGSAFIMSRKISGEGEEDKLNLKLLSPRRWVATFAFSHFLFFPLFSYLSFFHRFLFLSFIPFHDLFFLTQLLIPLPFRLLLHFAILLFFLWALGPVMI